MKKFFLPAILFFVLLVAASYFFLRDRDSRMGGKGRDFGVADTSRVVRIEIYSGDELLKLDRQQGPWMVNGMYHAQDMLISRLLTLIMRVKADMPMSTTTIEELRSNLGDELKRVTILISTKEEKSYYLWHDSTDTKASYMMMTDSEVPFRIQLPGFRISNISTFYQVDENYWRDNTLFRLLPDQISSIRLEYPAHPDESFLLERGDGENWSLYRLTGHELVENISRENLSAYLYNYSHVRFDEIIASPVDLGRFALSEKPFVRLTLLDTRGSGKTVSFYSRYEINENDKAEMDLDRLYLRINDSDEILQARYVQVDLILKELSYFISN